MKKLNKQEITAIVNKIQEQYNKKVEKATKNAKLTKEQEATIASIRELPLYGARIYEMEKEYRKCGNIIFEQYKEQCPESDVPNINDFFIIKYSTADDCKNWCNMIINAITDIFIQKNIGLKPFETIRESVYDSIVLESISKDFNVNMFIDKTIQNLIKK